MNDFFVYSNKKKDIINGILCFFKSNVHWKGTLNAWNRMLYKNSCTLKALYNYGSWINWMHWKTKYQTLKCAKNAK